MDSGLENWHDFEVESRREIIALLRSISEKNQLIRMLIHGESDVCVTSILEVDADHNTVILDRSVNNDQNRRMLAAKGISFETSLDAAGWPLSSLTIAGKPEAAEPAEADDA